MYIAVQDLNCGANIYFFVKVIIMLRIISPGPIFCLLLGVSSGCAQLITGQVTSVTWPVIG